MVRTRTDYTSDSRPQCHCAKHYFIFAYRSQRRLRLRSAKGAERDKLDNIPFGEPAAGGKATVVAVELLHCVKIAIADTDNDDGERQRGRLKDENLSKRCKFFRRKPRT